MEALEAFKKFKNEAGTYDIDESSLKEILSKFIPTPKAKTKRKPSTYMMWLNDNRQSIKQKYFSDYDSIKTWDEDTVTEYYNDKGLGEPKKLKKPNMCILISVKAGKLWKDLSDAEKSKYSKPKSSDSVVEKPKDDEVEKPKDDEVEKPKDDEVEKPKDAEVEKPKDAEVEKPKKKVKKVVKKGGKK
jgi:hypothetical protein